MYFECDICVNCANFVLNRLDKTTLPLIVTFNANGTFNFTVLFIHSYLYNAFVLFPISGHNSQLSICRLASIF